jgi:RNA polymerase sigma-70 factor, ECF subfamily
VTPDQELQAGQWMLCAQQGDQRAYEELLRLVAREARSFVGRRIAWADWTEDVVQEVLLTVHRTRHTYDPARPFAPWFYAIASSRLIDVLRSRKRVTTREVADEEAMAAQPAPHRDGAGAERRSDVSEALAQAVARLPRVQREVVSLLKYEDLSVREVAARMQMTEGAVKAMAHRGYKVLRRTVGAAIAQYRSIG